MWTSARPRCLARPVRWGIAFDKTGKVLASGHYDGTVRLWGMADPRRPTALATLTGHSGPVTSVAFSPDGKTLASVSYDHTAKLWDVSDPATRRCCRPWPRRPGSWSRGLRPRPKR